MGSRYRKQESVRLTLSDGDYLIVRSHLTAGEERGIYAKLWTGGVIHPGKAPTIDPEHAGLTQVAAYLLDWSITDADDQPIVIRDQSYEFIASALQNMTPESLKEIVDAIQAHDAAMAALRAEEKKTRAGSNAPDPISTSVA